MACGVENGSEYRPDLQGEEGRLCTGMDGDKVENTMHTSLTFRWRRAGSRSGMNDMLCRNSTVYRSDLAGEMQMVYKNCPAKAQSIPHLGSTF